MSYFLLPYRVACEVEADTFVLVVGVNLASLLVDVPLLIESAATANVLTATSKPFGGGTEEVEDMVASIVADSHDLFTATATVVCPSVAVAILVEVFPAFTHTALAFLWYIFLPLLAFVVGFVSFHKLAVAGVNPRPIGRDV